MIKSNPDRPVTARAVLLAAGLSPTKVERWEVGARSVHWTATTADGPIFVTRLERHRTIEDLRWQSDLMDRFRTLGWPVPQAVRDPIVVGDRVWCFFERLPGRPRSPRTPASIRAEQRRRGRMIARFQSDAASIGPLNQRPGGSRVDERFARTPPIDEVFGAWETRLPREIAILRRHLELTRSLFAELDPGSLPSIPIHGDLAPWNLLYQEGRLTALLDFEFACMDLRVAEFAHSWRGRHDEIVYGYLEDAPLDERELALVTPVRWAWLLDGARAVLALSEGQPDLEWVMTQIARRSPLMDHASRKLRQPAT